MTEHLAIPRHSSPLSWLHAVYQPIISDSQARICPVHRISRWMEPANEDIASVPPHQPRPSSPTQSSSPPSDIINNDTIAASLSDGVAVSNGSILPRAQDLSNKDRPVSGIVPPYWSHHRNASRASHISLDQAPGITLEDHTEDPDCETSRGLWAKSVVVDDHVVVQGKTGIGSYVVWNCRIQTLDVRQRSLSRLSSLLCDAISPCS